MSTDDPQHDELLAQRHMADRATNLADALDAWAFKREKVLSVLDIKGAAQARKLAASMRRGAELVDPTSDVPASIRVGLEKQLGMLEMAAQMLLFAPGETVTASGYQRPANDRSDRSDPGSGPRRRIDRAARWCPTRRDLVPVPDTASGGGRRN
jgi:hypothetical protein